MMGKSAEPDSFFQKLLSKISNLNPSSRQQMLDQITEILSNSIVEVIDGHNTPSAVFIFTFGRKKYVIKAEFGTKRNSVKKEIGWYSKVGKDLSYVPRYITSTKTKRLAVLVLAYIEDAATLNKISFDPKTDPKCVLSLIEKSLAHLNELFNNNPQRQVSVSEADKLFIGKLEKRTKQAKAYKYLKELFNLNGIYINGKKFRNLFYYVSKIHKNRKLFEYLTPTLQGVIHGDLHCGNIFVRKDNVYFIDPNGDLAMPIEYDYGKIFHSIHGGYDSIMVGNYHFIELENGKHEFSVDIPRSYVYSFNIIKNKLSDKLLVRALYTEAMHFATMLPHHAKNKIETKALFLRGLMLFKKLFKLL